MRYSTTRSVDVLGRWREGHAAKVREKAGTARGAMQFSRQIRQITSRTGGVRCWPSTICAMRSTRCVGGLAMEIDSRSRDYS
jgi:hypothetical protein